MSDPYVREVGSVEGLDGERLSVGVDYDTVAIYVGCWLSADGVRLSPDGQEELGRLLVSAVWQAGQQKRALDEEIHEADGGDSMAGSDPG